MLSSTFTIAGKTLKNQRVFFWSETIASGCEGLVSAAVYGPRGHDIDSVILLARKLDLADLEMLLDTGAE